MIVRGVRAGVYEFWQVRLKCARPNFLGGCGQRAGERALGYRSTCVVAIVLKTQPGEQPSEVGNSRGERE